MDELPDPLRLVLFTLYRDLLLWTSVEPEAREGLFVRDLPVVDCVVETTLGASGAADAIATLRVAARDPTHVRSSALADACSELSDWAANVGYPSTCLAFAELGAAVAPANPELAYRAGRAARRHGRYDRGHQWFELSVALARRANDKATYTSALMGWGLMEEQRGRRDTARRRLTQAWKASRRWKLRKLGAAARHNLMTLEIPDGDLDLAESHAASAFRLYGCQDPNLYRLANDTACLWAARGFFEPALLVFKAALPLFTRPAERAQVIANVGRAAAALGDRSDFLDACDAVSQSARCTKELLAPALVNLARGAMTLGYKQRARALAEEAITHAKDLHDSYTEKLAKSLIDDIAREGARDAPRSPPNEVRCRAQEFCDALGKRTSGA